MSPSLHFCTLFDSRYATRALTMLDSLERTCEEPFDVTILAMDEAVPALLAKLGKPNWKVVRVADLSDTEFTALETVRARREFCWTAAPVLCKRMIDLAQENDFVVYVDADLMFYDSPVVLLRELDQGGTVLIHEHRYSPDKVQYEATSGRFNVGFVAFRVGCEARRCANRWRDQVIDKCELDPDNGYCGDQGYLNEWPSLYAGLRIMANIGGGVAPWNLNGYRARGSLAKPLVDETPLVFFHYHAFRTVAAGPFRLIAARPAFGYSFPLSFNRLFFALYTRRIRKFSILAEKAGFAAPADEAVALPELIRGMLAGRYVPAVGL